LQWQQTTRAGLQEYPAISNRENSQQRLTPALRNNNPAKGFTITLPLPSTATLYIYTSNLRIHGHNIITVVQNKNAVQEENTKADANESMMKDQAVYCKL